MIESWTDAAPAGMDNDQLLNTLDLVRNHPWWHARARLVLKLLSRFNVPSGARVLDAGCGWGVTLSALERAGYAAVGLDGARKILEGIDAPQRHLIHADLTRLPQTSSRFDAILALDVIEHIDDDARVLEQLATMLAPGGHLLVSVPALPEIWSRFDEIQGHRRRYTPESLRNAFGRHFELKAVYYWGAWLVPFLKRQRSRLEASAIGPAAQLYARYLGPPHALLKPALRLAFELDERRAIAGRLKRGTSLFAVATLAGGTHSERAGAAAPGAIDVPLSRQRASAMTA